MKAVRWPGRLEDDDGRLARAFALGCVGAAEAGSADRPEVVAYFHGVVELPFEGDWEDVDEVDYVAAYRRDLQPLRVGALVVAPSHSRVELAVGEKVLWLDPGLAFGTGHHETTRMALAALGRLDLVGRSVLDVGAGSGILAIAADLFGASTALGIDTDASTVPVARANARLNRSRATFLAGSLDHPELPCRFDTIVANLYAELHAASMEAYLARLNQGGRALLTGILERLEPLVRDAVPARAAVHAWREAGWVLLEIAAPGGGPVAREGS